MKPATRRGAGFGDGADLPHSVLRFVAEGLIRVAAQTEVGLRQVGGDALEG